MKCGSLLYMSRNSDYQWKSLELRYCGFLDLMPWLFGRTWVDWLLFSVPHSVIVLTKGVFIVLAYAAMHVLLVERR
jgi:hypothetical protein